MIISPVDQLHAMELYILEELDNCSFETFDLLSFDEDGNGAESIEKELAIPGNLAEKPSLDEWEVSLYEVEFHKRIGRGSAGTTYLAKWARQDVAVKVAATNDLGLEGWKAEIASLKKVRFLLLMAALHFFDVSHPRYSCTIPT